MGFFLAGFIRDQAPTAAQDAQFLRDERGHLVRDLLGFPVMAIAENQSAELQKENEPSNGGIGIEENIGEDIEEEWEGFGHEAPDSHETVHSEAPAEPDYRKRKEVASKGKHSYNPNKKRADLVSKSKKRQK
jgi:putative methyltransferase